MSYDTWKSTEPDLGEQRGSEDVYRPIQCRDCRTADARHHAPTGSYCSDCWFARVKEGWHFDPRSIEQLKASAA